MSAIYYDCEFLERGHNHPISLISMGLVADNGDELYRVMGDTLTMSQAVKHPWLAANIVPMLPIRIDTTSGLGFRWDTDHPDYRNIRTRQDFAKEVLDFIRAHGGDKPELWAWYADYDHVALCQLWGTMAELPDGLPMWSHDLIQQFDLAGLNEAPSMPGRRAHHALDDAREVKWRRVWLATLEGDNLLAADQ